MLDLISRFTNGLALGIFLGVIGLGLYNFTPAAWTAIDNACIGAAAIVALVGALLLGFGLLDQRRF